MKHKTVIFDNGHRTLTAFQCNITRAKKLLERGHELYINPANMRVPNPWQNPRRLVLKEGQTFEQFVEQFKFYNCDNKRGRYPVFFFTGRRR